MGISSQGLVRVDMFKPESVTAPKLGSTTDDAGDVVVGSMTEPDEAIPEILAYDNSPGESTKAELPGQRRSKQKAAASSDDDTANTSRSGI